MGRGYFRLGRRCYENALQSTIGSMCRRIVMKVGKRGELLMLSVVSAVFGDRAPLVVCASVVAPPRLHVRVVRRALPHFIRVYHCTQPAEEKRVYKLSSTLKIANRPLVRFSLSVISVY